MAGRDNRPLVFVVGLLIVSLLAGGCGREETAPDVRQARLIAAESMQLKQRLADLEGQIDELKAQHAQDLERREEQLAACQKRAEALEQDLRQGVARRVEGVTATVMAENARLRQELEQLRAELQQLQAQSSERP